MLAHFLALFLAALIPQPTDTPGGPIAALNASVPAVTATIEAPRTLPELPLA
jgi:hypothetical protein